MLAGCISWLGFADKVLPHLVHAHRHDPIIAVDASSYTPEGFPSDQVSHFFCHPLPAGRPIHTGRAKPPRLGGVDGVNTDALAGYR